MYVIIFGEFCSMPLAGWRSCKQVDLFGDRFPTHMADLEGLRALRTRGVST